MGYLICAYAWDILLYYVQEITEDEILEKQIFALLHLEKGIDFQILHI